MDKLTPLEKIKKAKIFLINKRPWFGQLSTYLNEVETNKVPTAATDIRGNLYYNAEFIDKLSDEQVRYVLCHEVMHLSFRHLSRMGDRDQSMLWNVAADIKVNFELNRERDIVIPKSVINPNPYSDECVLDNAGITIYKVSEKTSENIYEELLHKLKSQQSQQDSLDGLIGQDIILPADDSDAKELQDRGFTPVSTKEAESLGRAWAQRAAEAAQVAQGDTPAGIKRMLNKLQQPDVDWRHLISERFRKLFINYSWRTPNKNWLPWYFPGRTRQGGIKCVCAVDTSGSISQEQLTKFISEIYHLSEQFQHMEMYITDCDAEVYSLKKYKKSEIMSLLLSGGGGTDFNPVFDYVKKKMNDNIDCLIFFTDLYGDFPTRKPKYDTFWITDTAPDSGPEIPFGRRVQLNNNL